MSKIIERTYFNKHSFVCCRKRGWLGKLPLLHELSIVPTVRQQAFILVGYLKMIHESHYDTYCRQTTKLFLRSCRNFIA